MKWGCLGLIIFLLIVFLARPYYFNEYEQNQILATEVVPYLSYLGECEYGTIRHLKGLHDHDWSEIWACQVGNQVKSATYICLPICSKTIIVTVYKDWKIIDKAIEKGDYIWPKESSE